MTRSYKDYKEELDKDNYVLREKPVVHAMVEHALKNGWRPKEIEGIEYQDIEVDRNARGQLVVSFIHEGLPVRVLHWKDLMFNIQFNKAVWGDDWRVHMQNTVILDNVFSYLHNSLTKKEILDNEIK